MLSGLRNLARRIVQRSWYPILIPYFRIVDGAMSSRARDLVEAMALCDGTRTLAAVSWASKVSVSRLYAETEAEQGMLLLWDRPLRPMVNYRTPQAVLLSPHLDDAALSLGRLMLFGEVDDVIDVFSRVSWWRFEIPEGVLPVVQRTRDAEEDLVMRLTRCNLHRWEFAEAPLRGYPLREIFTTARLPEAVAMHERIRERVRTFAAEKPEARWYLPLAIGNHIDHRIARDAALDGLRDAKRSMDTIRFYEDLPYVAQQPGVQDFSDFLSAVVPGARLASEMEHVKAPSKRRLLRAYYSQLTASQIELVGKYGLRISSRNFERVWRFDDETSRRNGGQIPPLGPLV
jgi:hypothetical protein